MVIAFLMWYYNVIVYPSHRLHCQFMIKLSNLAFLLRLHLFDSPLGCKLGFVSVFSSFYSPLALTFVSSFVGVLCIKSGKHNTNTTNRPAVVPTPIKYSLYPIQSFIFFSLHAHFFSVTLSFPSTNSNIFFLAFLLSFSSFNPPPSSYFSSHPPRLYSSIVHEQYLSASYISEKSETCATSSTKKFILTSRPLLFQFSSHPYNTIFARARIHTLAYSLLYV